MRSLAGIRRAGWRSAKVHTNLERGTINCRCVGKKQFRSGEVTLSGALHVPDANDLVGAVVVTHTASKPLRDAPLYDHVIQSLTSLGIAVLVYDRRGSGQSGGKLIGSEYAVLADDAVAATQMLKANPRIDPERIGVWGLSQGGWLSLLAASRSDDVRFVISIAAPLVPPDVQLLSRSESSLQINGHSESDIQQMRAARLAVDNYMRGHGHRGHAQKLVDSIKFKPWFDQLYLSETVGDRSTSRWRKEIEFDPLPALEKVRVSACCYLDRTIQLSPL